MGCRSVNTAEGGPPAYGGVIPLRGLRYLSKAPRPRPQGFCIYSGSDDTFCLLFPSAFRRQALLHVRVDLVADINYISMQSNAKTFLRPCRL